MTSRPKSTDKMTAVEYYFHVRTSSIFAFDHDEKVHASGFSHSHTQIISIPVAKEPENLLVAHFRGFLLG